MAKVYLTEPAEYDLIDIEYYIHVDLSNPQASLRIIDGIVKTLRGLELFPKEHMLVNDELLKSMGLNHPHAFLMQKLITYNSHII